LKSRGKELVFKQGFATWYGNIRSRDTGIKWNGLMVAWNKGLFPCIVFFHSEPSAPRSTTGKVNGLLDQRILPGNSCWAAAVLHMVKTAFREEPPAAEEHGSGPIFHLKTLETHLFHHAPRVTNIFSLVLQVYGPLKHQ